MALPVNIAIMDVDQLIAHDNIMPVTTAFIKEPSSQEFHHNGLFSEEIFGQIGSPERLITFGYINLRTTILHPLLYNNLLRLKALYGEILQGKTYAIYDNESKDFIKAIDEGEEGAGTGYKFFVSKLHSLDLKKNQSLTRTDRIDVFNKYKDLIKLKNCLVLPAGLRDMQATEFKVESDSINAVYSSLLSYVQALPMNGSENAIYDTLRFAIQKKVNEVFQYIFDMVEGKRGFFQGRYTARSLALGTRNVLSASMMSASSPDDPQYLKLDEIKLPVFQAAKMYMPLVVYNMRELFLNEVFSQSSDQVSLIDVKTYALQYQPVSEEEKQHFLSPDGIEKIVNLYKDREFRGNPVMIYNEDNVPFYLFMVYDDGDEIYYTRSVVELKSSFNQHGKKFDPKKLRPLTYIEMLYVSVFRAALGKCATVTRYPAVGIGSAVPCKAHIVSTQPARTVMLVSQNDNLPTMELPQYPILGNQSIDSTQVHPAILIGSTGLGGDFDGDTVSVSGILTEEANIEANAYLNSKSRFVHTSGNLFVSDTDLLSLTTYNLTRDPVK